MDRTGSKATTPFDIGIVDIPVRTVTVDRSSEWLAAGWHDLKQARAVGLAYGLGFVVVSFLLTIGLIRAELGSVVLPLFGAFLLVAPIQVVGLYEISRRIGRSQSATFADAWAACAGKATHIGAIGIVFMIVALAWILVALILFALFFHSQPPQIDSFIETIVFSKEGALFLLIGTAIGGVFATVLFAISAVSVPLLMDRDVDVVTAMVTSVRAVRANPTVMFGWAAMIVVMIGAGIVTFFLGFIIILPVLAFATWHAYRDLVGAQS